MPLPVTPERPGRDAQTPRRRRGALLGVAVAVLAALLFAGVFLSPLEGPAQHQGVLTVPNCDLGGGPCEAVFPGGERLKLSIAPTPVPLLKPLRFHVTTNGLEVVAARVEVTGLNMDMGLLRTELRSTAVGLTGETVLPICSRRRMHWQARVLLDSPRGTYAASFPFHTERP